MLFATLINSSTAIYMLEESSVPRRFEILKPIGLGFFNGREQYDLFVDPGQGVLEFDGADIYWVIDGERKLSETINEAISIWLEMGKIEEIPVVQPNSSGGHI